MPQANSRFTVAGFSLRPLAETVGFYQPFLAHTLAKLRERYAPMAESLLDFLCKSPLFVESRNGLLRDGLLAYEREDFVKAIHVLVPSDRGHSPQVPRSLGATYS